MRPSDTFECNLSFGSPVEAEAQQNRPILNPSCKNTLSRPHLAQHYLLSLSLSLSSRGSLAPPPLAPAAGSKAASSSGLRPFAGGWERAPQPGSTTTGRRQRESQVT